MKTLAACAAACLLLAAAPCRAHSITPPSVPVPPAFAVHGALMPLPGVAELRFRELFRLPVGPRGLEPSERLLALDGQTVRIVGYMAQLAAAPEGLLILSPLPVSLGGEDESFADDLPASAVYVHLADAGGRVPPLAGLMALTGRLQVGAEPEADGRVSFVRLFIDAASSRSLVRARLLPLEKPDVAFR